MHVYETEHLQLLRQDLGGCTVLLKKDGSFPLTGPCALAACGSGVRHTVKGGTGSGEVNSRNFVTVEQGLREAGFTLTTGLWLDAYDGVLDGARQRFIRDIKARARKKGTLAVLEGMGAVMPEPEYDLPLAEAGEAAVYVVSRISGEGSDRTVTPGDFLLTATEIRDILALNERFDRFMLVLNVGGPVDLTPVQTVKNILVLSQLGTQTGHVLADLLLGKTCPSGKLTATWAPAEAYPDAGDFGGINDTCYKEGIYVGYRWFDAADKPCLYPFGFGLGYTEFRLSETRVKVRGSRISLRTRVENVGAHPGRETLQVYLSCPQGRLDKPPKDLAAFCKSCLLQPGQSQVLETEFDLRHHGAYDEARAAYVLEAGRYGVLCGTGGGLQAAAVLALEREVTLRQVKKLLGDPGFADWKPETAPRTWAAPVITLSPEAFRAEQICYEERDPVEPEIRELTDKQLCLLGIGSFDPKGGVASIIGSASTTVAGAAGESTSLVAGIPAIVMADGPAGVRLSQRYYRDEKGAHGLSPALPQSILAFLPAPLRALLGGTPRLPKGAQLQEQYCTALPIGTALAQSWDTDFAACCGRIVGAEMARFGVHLWLAPALNIHRSPLCGRNFEYFSEDPLLSGRFAAALTRAVQAEPGRGVTLKHFAANNQETNRYFSNSRVSCRALREIYLRGFAIAVREGRPRAVMTSYNLLNGVHTAESRELCVDVLRREFGFRGLCMTDWVVRAMGPAKGSVHPAPDPARVAAAGGDLFMPGSRADLKALEAGLERGTVSRRVLEENASRLLRLAREREE